MLTCSKTWTNFPFAHRQPKHDGHCALIHGHNWDFSATFVADKLDENGFVCDFGKLKSVKAWLTEHFDHTLVLVDDDELIGLLGGTKYAKIIPLEDTSCEGLACFFYHWLEDELFSLFGGRVSCLHVTVYENEFNYATYEPES